MNPRYQRLDNESDIEYLLRLTEIKMEEKPDDLDWQDIVNLCNLSCHYDSLRKAMQPNGYGAYYIYKYFKQNKEKEQITEDDILKEYELKRIALEKERQKFYDQRTSYKKLIRNDARWEEIYEIIEETIQSGNLPILEHKYQTIEHSDNDLLVFLNDLHYGADIKNAWNTYNPDICIERLDNYINHILDIKKIHNSENIYVCANGDLISGNIHHSIEVSNREDIIQQVMGVAEIISQFLAELSNSFGKVIFTVVAGNHSRIDTKERSLKNERLEILIPWYIKARLQNFDNIYYTENKDVTMAVVNIRGKQYLNVHGDYDSGKSAKQACALMAGDNIYAICCGHLHHNLTDYVDSMKVIMSGSFLGMDDYCIKNRIISIPQQLVCVCNENGVLCAYDINF